ncbi:carboxylesterase/lipase family protein [Altererythrobacter sp. Root672]|uniref:carboxylesterase/lipase family protein n=1 Tax=Altererythrobacter sp. Root672 TaxID=1736584 RepID=UPI0006F655A5|nr:carboxylesterase family protein [Altererythrobacter sp. Root672]KRA83962.1 carboxylesterase [Altererythrobacter sp. Root672]
MRRVLPFIALVASACLVSPALAQDTSVTVESGALKGTSADGVLSWKGIPFAAPPVGDLRWRNPQPAAHWQGARDASAYGNDCMQVPFPSDAAPLGTPPAEDCLYTNVWRPAGAKGKLPVVFWIYGGGFVNGGASPPTYSGAELAKQGVVFVSANYRVGRFGTFAHPALTKANEDGGLLGNYGYMDQLAALQWVKRNIAAFGGDPENVTIIGESAGGMSVHALVTSPMAEGLFDRAVVMSGGDGGGMGGSTLASTEEVGSTFAQKFGIAANDPQALAKLRALSAEQVTDGLSMMALFAPNGPRTFASPFADGKLAMDAGAAYRSGQFAHVPIMIGATSADIGGKTGPMIAGARNISTVIAGKGVPVYAYRFSYVAENPPPGPAGAPAQDGAGHASDIPFFFDTQAIKYEDRTTPRDNAMGEAISAYLVNFAKTGNPNGAGLPAWPKYDRSKDEIMDFATNGKAVPGKDPWGAELDAAAR